MGARFVEQKLETCRIPHKGSNSITNMQRAVGGGSSNAVISCCQPEESSDEESEQELAQDNSSSTAARSIPPVLLHCAVSAVKATLKMLLFISIASFLGFNTLDVVALLSAFTFSV